MQMWRWSLPTMRLDRRYPVRNVSGHVVGIDPNAPFLRESKPGANFIHVAGGASSTEHSPEKIIAYSREHVVFRNDPTDKDVAITLTSVIGAAGAITHGTLGHPNWKLRSAKTGILMWDTEGRVIVVEPHRQIIRAHTING
jgi:hypothetical protein